MRTKRIEGVRINYYFGLCVYFNVRISNRYNAKWRGYQPTPASFQRLARVLAGMDTEHRVPGRSAASEPTP